MSGFEQVVVKCKRCGGSGTDPVKQKNRIYNKKDKTYVTEEVTKACTSCGGGGTVIEYHRKRGK